MAYNRNNDYTLTHYLNLTDQRNTILDQVPFFLSLKNNPPALRRVLEVVLALHWNITNVASSGTHTVAANDVVIFSGHSTTITLPIVTTGRVLVIKDTSGAAGTSGQAITINRAGSDTIDGSNTSFSLAANYGAIVIIGDLGNTKWHTIALV